MSDSRPVVCLVTTHWGNSEDETTEVVRLLAGAIARSAVVHVVHLDRNSTGPATAMDSVFFVHRLPLLHASPKVAAVVRAALAISNGDPSRSLTTAMHAFEGEVDNIRRGVRPQLEVAGGPQLRLEHHRPRRGRADGDDVPSYAASVVHGPDDVTAPESV